MAALARSSAALGAALLLLALAALAGVDAHA